MCVCVSVCECTVERTECEVSEHDVCVGKCVFTTRRVKSCSCFMVTSHSDAHFLVIMH